MAKRFLTAVEALTATFSSNVSASASPTEDYHLSNKFYVDSRRLNDLSGVNITNVKSGELLRYDDINDRWINDEAPRPIVQSGSVLPESPTNGEFFYNTNSQDLYFFFNNWKTVGLIDIDLDGGTSSTTEFDLIVDGGDSETSIYEETYDGGNSST